MSTLEYTIYGIKRGWTVTRTFLFAGAFAAAVVGGFFSNLSSTGLKIPAMIAFGLWAAVFGSKIHKRLSVGRVFKDVSGKEELETGLLLVVALYAGIQTVGGLGSLVYPLVFVLVAFMVVYMRQWVGFTLVSATIAIEMALVLRSESEENLVQGCFHAAFIILFALINLVFTRTEVKRIRKKAIAQMEDDKSAVADDARDFRLTSALVGRSAPVDRAKDEARLSRCTVGEVRRSMYHHVDLLKRTMKLNTCLLLWLEAEGETLRLLECVSDSPYITQRKIGRKEGVIGAVLSSGKHLCLKGLKPGYPGIPYYQGNSIVTDFLGVPIVENGSLRGVLCADRTDGRQFGDVERENLAAASDSILQIISNERIFSQLQRAKSEQSQLLAASDSLTRALTEEDVLDASLEAAAQIAAFEVAVVALAKDTSSQVVRRACGKGTESLVGVTVGANGSLASSVMKNRHYLPYRGHFVQEQIVFSKRTQRTFLRMKSVLILPLGCKDEVLGTLTLATTEVNAFPEDVRTTLQVMTNQLGTALKNAQMVRKLEEMATTDALTGLPNHRVFQDELMRQVAQSNRFHTETSVILCDVDRFKSVNDTFGHPIGDIVLKGFGEVLRRNVVRDTDLPARYGGEEFAVICAGTDTDGAVKLAEKIRRDLEEQSFRTEKGVLRVTISMGVATFPSHARSKEDLVERADLALYFAKENGRNQVQVWRKGLKGK